MVAVHGQINITNGTIAMEPDMVRGAKAIYNLTKIASRRVGLPVHKRRRQTIELTYNLGTDVRPKLKLRRRAVRKRTTEIIREWDRTGDGISRTVIG